MSTTINSVTLDSNSCALFISDLHLCKSRPDIIQAFLAFLQANSSQEYTLFILGDFFEYWAGDDDINTPFHQTICQAINKVTASGTKVFLMHGNRDFLIGEHFASACNLSILSDPTMIKHKDQQILLSHGDALCTDDADYQAMRTQFRNHDWQAAFLSQPLSKRKAIIADLRNQSKAAKSEKSMAIMDVNNKAVSALLTQHDYPEVLIHGHTHRPNIHEHVVNGHQTTRYVLGDWYEQGSYLSLNAEGFQNHFLSK